MVEPYFDLKTPNSIARRRCAKVLVMAPVGRGEKEITDYVASSTTTCSSWWPPSRNDGAK
jgi:hypothetical protein